MRGTAAIAVMLFHIGSLSRSNDLAPYGYVAVDLFFVMSGFVIGNAYERVLTKSLSWRKFMMIRAGRLYPSLFLGALVGIVASPHASLATTWKQFFLIPSFETSELFPLNPVFWSLFFEIFINAAHALAIRQLTTRRLAIFCALAGVSFLVISYFNGGPGVGWGRSSFAAGFARVAWSYSAGLLIYRLHAGGRLPRMDFRWPVSAGIVAVLLLSPNFGLTFVQIPLMLFVAFPSLVAVSIQYKAGPRLTSLFAWLGAISYPLYAIHLPILRMSDRIVGHAPFGWQWIMIGVAVIAIASAAEYFYDAPIRRYLRRALR